MSIAVFPGSFDPVTVGHVDIIKRASTVFEKVVVAITPNPGKSGSEFTVEERLELLRDAVSDIENVELSVCTCSVLVEYCRSIGATVMVRGIRSGSDVEYESMLEQVNIRLAPEIQTVYLISRPEHAFISSSLVRQLISTGISIEGLVPNADHKYFKRG